MIAARQMTREPVAVRIGDLIEACRDVIAEHADHLCHLDRAIGDGDHGTNMLRGFDALLAERDRLDSQALNDAIGEAGTILVMTIGGASGPLYGTLLIEMGRQLAAFNNPQDFAYAFGMAVDAVARRGKSARGDKTMLDVLYPLSDLLRQGYMARTVLERVTGLAETTVAMRAMRGRASFLGKRSIGHLDPGAASCALLVSAICRQLDKE